MLLLKCSKCGRRTKPKLSGSPKTGMHVKASCGHCGAYVKFLNKGEQQRCLLVKG